MWETLGLDVITIVGDGNCQFSAISRGLRMGGVLSIPGESDVGAPALRRLVAASVTVSTIEDYMGVWGAMPEGDLSHALRGVDGAENRVAAARRAICSMDPVLYQGDDFSLGILSKSIGVNFLILRSDGTFQKGLPDIPDGCRVMLLRFDDITKGAVGVAHIGHYDLLVHRGRGLFTTMTLPSVVFQRAHACGIKLRDSPRAALAVPPDEADGETIEGDPDSPRIELFPVVIPQPTNGEEFGRALLSTIRTVRKRMRALGTPTLWQQYALTFRTGTAEIHLLAEAEPMLAITVAITVVDCFGDGVYDERHAASDAEEAAVITAATLESYAHETGPIVAASVRVGDGSMTPIHDIDAIFENV
jgi:hypothetical protein